MYQRTYHKVEQALPDRQHRTAAVAVPFAIATLMVGIALGQPGRAVAADAKSPTAAAAARPTPTTPAAPATNQAVAVSAPTSKMLDYQFQLQETYYYCGPAAARIAASAKGHVASQGDFAGRLGTTTFGTNSAVDTTRVLNQVDGVAFYHTTSIPGRSATPAQMDRLQADVVRAISNGYPVVANIVGTVTDTLGGQHSYGGGHYLTVVGYRDQGRTVLIADPADTVADGSYWVTTIDMANWMATRGYSS
jgi:hypothetical protein